MKALSLFSGGLDSQLAVCVVKEQGIDVVGLNFVSPFFDTGEKTAKAADDLGIELITVDFGEAYIEKVLRNPRYGYGKNMNPCIDCHGFMTKKAGDMMPELGASFIISGEVLGQRPMSQNKSSLVAVDKLSGYSGYVLRPLSAKLLKITIPEEQGWIDREKLLDISGRSRTRQMELASYYGLRDYPSPAGGCLLTEANYVRRLKGLLNIKPTACSNEMSILRVGRHFYIGNNILVVGRNKNENDLLEDMSLENDIFLKVSDRPGPTALLRAINKYTPQDLEYAAAITARYSDAKNEPLVRVKIYTVQGEITVLEVVPLSPENMPAMV